MLSRRLWLLVIYKEESEIVKMDGVNVLYYTCYNIEYIC